MNLKVGISALLTTLGIFLGSPLSGADTGTQSVSKCVAVLEQSIVSSGFLKTHSDFKFTKEANSITLSYHTREWMIHGVGKDGVYKEPRKEIGPDSDGLIITAWFLSIGPDSVEQWAGRHRTLDLAGMDGPEQPNRISNFIRRPYWRVYGCETVLLDRDALIRVNIELNNRTSHKLIEEAFAQITQAFAKDRMKTSPQ
jgi:hypothetical protein